MTLKQEIKAQLVALGYTGAIFFGQIPANVDACILLRDEGEHQSDPTRMRIYPQLSVFIRGSSRSDVETLARTIYDFFHVDAPLVLASGYRVSRSITGGLPRDLGKDAADLWRSSLDLNLTQPRNTEL